jgi:hypothetical protein
MTPSVSSSLDWSSLVQSIRDEEAVLVLGPDAIPYYHGDTVANFSQLTRQEVGEQLGEGVTHLYERDNLFQFRDARAKQEARKTIRSVCRSEHWQADTELLRQIVAMPFPVILNLNPDRRLFTAFAEYWQAPQFDYFTTKDKPDLSQLVYPDGRQQPLLYNLVGSVEDKMDSIILDYHDLFDLLKNLLSDHGVPEVLQRKLKEADHFVLLGMELERWYLQLYLHYINQLDNPFDNYNQNFPILCKLDGDRQPFVIKQFNITHHSLTREDFGDIYAACAEQPGLLRELREPGSPAAERIRQLVIAGKLDTAFAELAIALDKSMTNIDLPLLQGRYRSLLQEQRDGILSVEKQQLELNRIRYALLTFTAELPADG